MPDKIDIADTTIVRKTIFDHKEFYVFLWNLMTTKLGYTFNENDYSQWEKSSGTDIEFHWTFTRDFDTYTQFKIWMECKLRFLNKVKVKEGDDTVTKYDGEVELGIKGMLITDKDDKFKKNPILKHFKSFYDNIIYDETLTGYQVRMWEHIFYVEGEVKAFFDIPKF